MDTHLTLRLRLVLPVLSAATLALTACDVGPYEPVGKRTTGIVQGGGTNTTTIEGTWRRTLVFFDDFGYLHSSETTWTFETGGAAQRTIVTTNVTLGAADSTLTLARWRLDGSNVVIEFTAPSPGTITLEVRVQGTTLFLAGQEYQRVS
ncbi:MAG TPA: hypothetical protein VIK50_02445 [Gemmatimonadaceae bacterium]